MGNLSDNSNYPYGETLYATCVLPETSEDEVKKILKSFESKN